jgi:hypothetical protein
MGTVITIIRIRRGHGKARYCACDDKGNPIKGFNRLSDIRKFYLAPIKAGRFKLVRELDQEPDMTDVNETIKMLNAILESQTNKKKKKGVTTCQKMKNQSCRN